jgi:hypothetical protein
VSSRSAPVAAVSANSAIAVAIITAAAASRPSRRGPPPPRRRGRTAPGLLLLAAAARLLGHYRAGGGAQRLRDPGKDESPGRPAPVGRAHGGPGVQLHRALRKLDAGGGGARDGRDPRRGRGRGRPVRGPLGGRRTGGVRGGPVPRGGRRGGLVRGLRPVGGGGRVQGRRLRAAAEVRAADCPVDPDQQPPARCVRPLRRGLHGGAPVSGGSGRRGRASFLPKGGARAPDSHGTAR